MTIVSITLVAAVVVVVVIIKSIGGDGGGGVAKLKIEGDRTIWNISTIQYACLQFYIFSLALYEVQLDI